MSVKSPYSSSICPREKSRLACTVLALTLTGFSSFAAAADPVSIDLQFAGEFAGKPFDCASQYDNIGTSRATVQVSDYRLYVSRIRLLDASGAQTPVTLRDNGPWQHDDIALLDFENASGACTNGTAQTNSLVKLSAPAGEYTGVAFDVGVPFESNHQDPTLAASPLNLTSLFWNWRGGYRFMRVDLQPVGAGMGMKKTKTGSPGGMHGKGWALHLGSTGCDASSPTNAPADCAAPNRIAVVFPNAAPGSSTFVIDPEHVLGESDISKNTEGTSPGCMSAPDDPECVAVFTALGLAGDGTTQSLVTAR